MHLIIFSLKRPVLSPSKPFYRGKMTSYTSLYKGIQSHNLHWTTYYNRGSDIQYTLSARPYTIYRVTMIIFLIIDVYVS